MRCYNCGKKTSPIEGRVTMQVGDTSFTTITDVGHCTSCGKQSIQFQCKIEPLVPAVQEQVQEGKEKEYRA